MRLSSPSSTSKTRALLVCARSKFVWILSCAAICAFYLFAPSTVPQFMLRAPEPTICPPPPLSTPPQLIQPSAEVNILVTGGAGYIGSHMCLLLLTHPDVQYNIVVVDDLSRGDVRHMRTLAAIAEASGKQFTFVEGDVGDIVKMTALMTQYTIGIVIHFAGYAYASESVSFPLKYFDNIVTSTQHLLEAMSQAGVRRLVFSSSSATYGSIQNDKCDSPLKEFSPQHPVSPYGESKLMAEQIIRSFTHSRHLLGEDFSVSMLRYFNVIGADPDLRVGPIPKPHLSAYGRIVDSCFDAIINARPMRVYGDDYPTEDGSPVRDYIHVVDLVEAHRQIMQLVHHRQVEVYNVGIGVGYSVNQLIAACRAATASPVSTLVSPRRIGDPAVVLGDPSKLMAHLGWTPKFTDLTESVRTAWNWRQKIHKERPTFD